MSRNAQGLAASSWRPRLPLLGLAAALAAAAILLLVLGSGQSFIQDEWDIVLHRRGFTAEDYLLPHNEHLLLIPIVIYKGILATIGMKSTMPFHVVATALLTANGALLFVYLRRRVGDWLALIGVVPILVLGAGWLGLLWPFEMQLVGSMAAGVGMLLALEWEDPAADAVACALLAASIAFGSLGLAFALAAGLDVLLRRDLRRVYVPLIPALLWAVWYVVYGRDAPNFVTLDNVLHSPIFLIDGFASSLASLLGFKPPAPGGHMRVWEVPLLIVVAAALVYQARRRRAWSRGLWLAVTAAAGFWILAGANYIVGREPSTNRYQYIGAAFVLLVSAGLLRGVRPRSWALVPVVVVAAAATISNVSLLIGGRDILRGPSEVAPADLGAMDIARRTIDPAFTLSPDIAGDYAFTRVDAVSYFAAAEEYGTPAERPGEIERDSQRAQKQADIVLGHALPVTIDPIRGTGPAPSGPSPRLRGGAEARARSAGSCLELPASVTRAGARVTLPPGGVTVNARARPAALRLGRFDTVNFPLDAGKARPGRPLALGLPRDRAVQPWVLEVNSPGPVRVCGTGRG